MTTLTKIQVALNHEEPAIIIKGLDFFKNIILEEHNALSSFGYKGRGSGGSAHRVLFPSHPVDCVGTLLRFRQASPQLEELFVVWHLPGRDENRALCASHMDCLAAILHCSHAAQEFCKTVTHRILRECAKSLHMQLTSGNVPLVHSTLGLIIEMCRTSDQNCRDTYQKLMLSSTSLAPLVQKGKPVSFTLKPTVVPASVVPVGEDAPVAEKIYTDTRYMTMLLVITLLRGADMAMASEIFAVGSIFRKAYHNLSRDNADTAELIVEGVGIVLRNIPGSVGRFKYSLIDSSFLKSVLSLYDGEDERCSACAHRFMLAFCSHMTYNSVTPGVVACLATSLQGQVDLRHREVILIASVLSCYCSSSNRSTPSCCFSLLLAADSGCPESATAFAVEICRQCAQFVGPKADL